MNRKIKKSINQEKNNKKYAMEYYKDEAESLAHFALDTKILDRLFAKKGRLLDSTMGRGRHVIHFAQKGFEVSGNDYNIHMVQLVKKDLKEKNLDAALYNLDITNLSKIKNNFFHYVICMYNSLGSVHSKRNRQKAINELARVLKKGGIMAIHVHNMNGDLFNFRNMLWTLSGYFPRGIGMERGDYYYRHESLGTTYQHLFTLKEMRQHFKNAGLKIEKEIFLSKNQDRYCAGLLKHLRSGGFIFVCRK